MLFKISGQVGRKAGSAWTLSTLNNSINCWSIDLAFGYENLRYSSEMDTNDQCCSRLRQPTRQPVLCFPLLQCISTKMSSELVLGWFLTSNKTVKA